MNGDIATWSKHNAKGRQAPHITRVILINDERQVQYLILGWTQSP